MTTSRRRSVTTAVGAGVILVLGAGVLSAPAAGAASPPQRAAVPAADKFWASAWGPDKSFDQALGSGFGPAELVGSSPTPIVTATAATADGGLLVGGLFTSLAGATAPAHLVKLTANGELDTAFNAKLGSGFNGTVRAITVMSDQSIVVGGEFTAFDGDGSAPDGLFRLEATGEPRTAFNDNLGSGLSGAQSSTGLASTMLESRGGSLYVGGDFDKIGDKEVPRGLAAIQSNGTVITTVVGFNVAIGDGLDGPVHALTWADDDQSSLYVGGMFTSLDSDPATPGGLMRIDLYEGDAFHVAWDNEFNTNVGSWLDRPTTSDGVRALALRPDGDVVVGGRFWVALQPDSTESVPLVRVDGTGTLDDHWEFNSSPTTANRLGGVVQTLTSLPDGTLAVGWGQTHMIERSELMFLTDSGYNDPTDRPSRFRPADARGGWSSASVSTITPLADGSIVVGGSFATANNDEGTATWWSGQPAGTAADVADGLVRLTRLTVTAGTVESRGDVAGTAIDLDASGTLSDADAGYALSYTVDGQPPGVQIDPVTGHLTGAPDTLGTYTTRVTALLSDATKPRPTGAVTELTWTVIPDLARSTISTAAAEIISGSSTQVSVTLNDAHGAPLGERGKDQTVVITSEQGTVGPVTYDDAHHTYTAAFTATTPGAATVGYTVNDAPGEATAQLDVTAGPPAATTSTITATPAEITTGESATVEVTLKDAAGNLVSGADTGHVVAVATDHGTLTEVTAHDDGTYTAELTADTAGDATLTFTVNGWGAPTQASVHVTSDDGPGTGGGGDNGGGDGSGGGDNGGDDGSGGGDGSGNGGGGSGGDGGSGNGTGSGSGSGSGSGTASGAGTGGDRGGLPVTGVGGLPVLGGVAAALAAVGTLITALIVRRRSRADADGAAADGVDAL